METHKTAIVLGRIICHGVVRLNASGDVEGSITRGDYLLDLWIDDQEKDDVQVQK